MFLKAIEMQGFKSFADKTKISFEPGVTAVVGPNGSGKSNITESLRWALGESSAKSLRGGKMPDVIFAGTETRHALNYAQVTVILDNADGFITQARSEIRVERQIYRNGDSDYLIDGKKVRLRDIHDLFMDTGLGRDSFSIISQGRVEAIFNSKPEERRAIFEEAAGVLKYKTRKKETEQKLAQTQGNLDRLEDIIYELDLQVAPLEQQAQVAKTFLSLEEERQQVQLNLLIADIEQFNQDLTAYRHQLSQTQEALETYYQQREELETATQELKEKRQFLLREQEKSQVAILEKTQSLSDLRRQIDLANLASSQRAEQKLAIEERLTELALQKAKLAEQIQAKSEHLIRIETDLQQVRQSIKDLEEAIAQYSTDPEQLMENLRADFLKLMEQEADLSNELTALEALVASQEEQSQQKLEESKALQEEFEQLSQEGLRVVKELSLRQDNLEKLRQSYRQLSKELDSKEAQYQEKQTVLFDIMDELKNKRARHQSLSAILKNHSQFYAGVKFILQQAESLGGVIGAVSEHISFDLSYQVAMEVALGASSQHIIVQNEGAAKRSIDLLKRKKQGRATFLPLTTIRPRQLGKQQLSLLATSTGFLGMANDLVSFEVSLAAIFGYLLGATAIFDTLEHANQAAKTLSYQVRIVTLDGTELRPGGSFAGGASRQGNMTFIKPELEKLELDISQQEASQHELEKDLILDKQSLNQLKDQLEQLKEQGEEARLLEQKTQLEQDSLQQRLSELGNLLERLASSQSVSSVVDLKQRRLALQDSLAQVEQKKQSLTQELDKIKQDKDSIQENLAILSERLQQTRLQERDLLSADKFEQEHLQELQVNLQTTEEKILVTKQQLTDDQAQARPENIEQLEYYWATVEAEKNELEQAAIRRKLALEDCEAALEDLAERTAASHQKNEQFVREQTRLELAIESHSNHLRQFAKQLAEDYQLSFEEAKTQAQSVDNPVVVRQHLESLVKQIKQLGGVNVDAIAQFEELSQRLSFLLTQKTDLVEAKQMLLTTIDDMNSEVKERFKVTFEAIRESFKQTFRQMFGGGSSDLLLTDGDWLTAGVEISVQPPGKKIQSLNLMSGGEKALSALALLFAIIRVKTIPFVILDEVEAALDEANVKRFGDYLNRFDKSSQFIVVTHRKGTMAAADSIYGVTMQESGVSKIVSVKLKEAEHLMEK